MRKEARYIPFKVATSAQKKGTGIIIDVREPAEFREGHITDSINLPSTAFNERDYRPWNHLQIFLDCQSGGRARATAGKLQEAGWEEVYVLDRHIDEMEIEFSKKRWSIDQQFMFTLGILLAVFIIGYHWISDLFFIIPVVLCLGLIITTIIDKCYLRTGISKMPWNREKTDFELAKIKSSHPVKKPTVC